jgi:hypothetical protein
LEKIDDAADEVASLSAQSDNTKKLARMLREFSGYIEANRAFIPDYGDRWRNGEAISTAFVESAVNQIVSRRFVKKQQMRWTERGGHHLLQIRTVCSTANGAGPWSAGIPAWRLWPEEPRSALGFSRSPQTRSSKALCLALNAGNGIGVPKNSAISGHRFRDI